MSKNIACDNGKATEGTHDGGAASETGHKIHWVLSSEWWGGGEVQRWNQGDNWTFR